MINSLIKIAAIIMLYWHHSASASPLNAVFIASISLLAFIDAGSCIQELSTRSTGSFSAQLMGLKGWLLSVWGAVFYLLVALLSAFVLPFAPPSPSYPPQASRIPTEEQRRNAVRQPPPLSKIGGLPSSTRPPRTSPQPPSLPALQGTIPQKPFMQRPFTQGATPQRATPTNGTPSALPIEPTVSPQNITPRPETD